MASLCIFFDDALLDPVVLTICKWLLKDGSYLMDRQPARDLMSFIKGSMIASGLVSSVSSLSKSCAYAV